MIYYARHGESVANQEGYFAGLIDSPLTGQGLVQAARIAHHARNMGLVVDKLVTSPLKRAYNSAVITAKELCIPPEMIRVDHRLVEYDFGQLSGRQKEGVDHQAFYAAEGRESPADFHTRVDAALRDYSSTDETTLIIGHSFVRLMMLAIATGFDHMKFNEIPSDPNDNGLITRIDM